MRKSEARSAEELQWRGPKGRSGRACYAAFGKAVEPLGITVANLLRRALVGRDGHRGERQRREAAEACVGPEGRRRERAEGRLLR